MSYRLIFSGIAVSVLITPFISGNLGMAGGIILLGLTAFVSYLLPPRMSLNVDGRGHPMLCGALCTMLQLVAGVSGPLLDAFFVRSAMDRRGVVATKAMSQTLGHLIKIGRY